MNTKIEIAKLLLQIKAVTLNLKQPYRYSSGMLSPIYCDNRLIMSYPQARQLVINAFIQTIHDHNVVPDVVVGTATAGIAHAAWIAAELNKPMAYGRVKTKEHGKKNQIEGKVKPGQKALIVEDLVSTGSSAITTGRNLRAAGAIVTDCVAIFTYQMAQATSEFSKESIQLHALSDFTTLITVASQTGYIDEEEKAQALTWSQNPSDWGKKIGLV